MFNLVNVALAATQDCAIKSSFDWANLSQGIIPQPGPEGYGCEQFNQLLANLFTLLITFAIPLAALVIAYGAFMLLISAGNEERISSGKNAIFSAVVGVVIVLGSFIVYNLVIRALIG